jgi:hypothetical protein
MHRRSPSRQNIWAAVPARASQPRMFNSRLILRKTSQNLVTEVDPVPIETSPVCSSFSQERFTCQIAFSSLYIKYVQKPTINQGFGIYLHLDAGANPTPGSHIFKKGTAILSFRLMVFWSIRSMYFPSFDVLSRVPLLCFKDCLRYSNLSFPFIYPK